MPTATRRVSLPGAPASSPNVADFPGPLAGILAALDWTAEDGQTVAWVLSAPAMPVPAARSGRSAAHGARKNRTRSSQSQLQADNPIR